MTAADVQPQPAAPNASGRPPKRFDRLPRGVRIYFLPLSAIGLALVVYFTFGFSIGDFVMLDVQYYYLIFGCFGSLVFLIMPDRSPARWFDYGLSAVLMGLCLYFAWHGSDIALVGWVPASRFHFGLGCLFLIIILEGCRRVTGLALPLVAVILGIYPLVAGYLPGVFEGIPYPLPKVVAFYAFGGEGVRGVPAQVMGGIMMGFLIFAGLLIATGAGSFFLDSAYALLGKYRGGPAKVAVVASGFFGSLSGGVASNIVATGTITIPEIKRMGYPAHYAAALEACASTGGALMPPVMGVVAFVMASMLNIPYADIVIAAIIPSVLFYWGLLMQADAHAAKMGMKGLPPERLPKGREVLKKGWPFLTVLVFLVWGLVIMKWETRTPFYASLLTIALSFFRRETRLTGRKLIQSLFEVGSLVVTTMAIMLPVGILVSAITVTGVGAAFSSGAIGLGGDNLITILLLGVLACYIMGMAGILVAAYVFLAVTMAPAIVQLGGLNILAVHLFIMYYANLSMITPPVAGGAFIASAIAGSPPMKTSFTAMRLGIVIYFIPFFFLFSPALILQGPLWESAYLVAFCLVGILLIAAGFEGYLLLVGPISILERIGFIVGGFMIAFPTWRSAIYGTLLTALTLIGGRWIRARRRSQNRVRS